MTASRSIPVHSAGGEDIAEHRQIASADGSLVASRERSSRIFNIAAGLAREPDLLFVPTAEVSFAEQVKLGDILRRLHAPEYLAALQIGEAGGNDGAEIGAVASRHAAPGVLPDTPIDDQAFERAFSAAMASLRAAQTLTSGQARYSYALCRPPGHHAGRAFLGGYCFLNNAAVAALALVDSGRGPVHVLDIDYHVGNGTSDVLSRHPAVGFTSLHASTEDAFPYIPVAGPAHPSHRYIAFSSPPSPAAYLDALDTALREAGRAEIFVVSVGFDIISGDPHGGWDLPVSIFDAIGKRLAAMARPICFVQEGGYLTDALADCASALMSGLIEPMTV